MSLLETHRARAHRTWLGSRLRPREELRGRAQMPLLIRLYIKFEPDFRLIADFEGQYFVDQHRASKNYRRHGLFKRLGRKKVKIGALGGLADHPVWFPCSLEY